MPKSTAQRLEKDPQQTIGKFHPASTPRVLSTVSRENLVPPPLRSLAAPLRWIQASSRLQGPFPDGALAQFMQQCWR
jgi:hypothetical protein